ncbi:MAG: TIGR00701 family protein [Pelagibacterales bacterium]|nr:TIGR00701 family protein [Pelagibacterales bacterium]
MFMYLFLKSAHIISFVAWMAGLLYLPRLFVYHSEENFNTKIYKKFSLMEKRLLKLIMNPAMISTWIFGIALAFYNLNSNIFSLWFILKLILVIILSAFHGFLSICRKNFINNSNTKSSFFYRIINEIPTVILIFVVLLVVFKPTL